MASIAYTEGFYYVPRIDKSVIEQYKKDIIVLSGNLYGEISSKILNVGEKQAENALIWWQRQFGDDFYLEIMQHEQEDERRVNQTLKVLAQKFDIKLIATNNNYYCDQEDANAHDILLCVKDGEKQATPIGRGRGYRYGLPNQEYYFKSSEDMKFIFKDIPEAIINIQEVIDKVEEPYVKLSLFSPQEHVGKLMDYIHERRGVYVELITVSDTMNTLIYEIPLSEIVFDFFNAVKSISKGYASFDYELLGYQAADLVKMDILVNHEVVDALSMIVPKSRAYHMGKEIVAKLKDIIPRHNFEIPIQAALGGSIISRETVKAYRKDVTAKLYGGDISRKKKLLQKQKKGKKRMKQIGNVEVPQKAFLAVLKLD